MKLSISKGKYAIGLLLLLVAFSSCGTYNTKTSDIEANLFNGAYDKAVSGIEKNSFLNKKRNRLLYLLEKGKVEHMRGNYAESNKLLEEAYIMIEDRIKTKAGQAVAAKFTNPMAEPYKGEDFEKVTLFYYKALNYFALGMPNEALVEAKRINLKLYELNENYKENKNRYSEDAFSQILQGILYESTGDINNAFIAYRNAAEIYGRNNGEYFGVTTPVQLQKDLLRTAKLMGFTQEYNDYRNKFKLPADDSGAKTSAADYQAANKGEAVIFWENGIGPAKDQIVITASGAAGIFYGSYMDGDHLEEIIIPIPVGSDIGTVNAIAIPRYRERGSYYTGAEIDVNGKPQPFYLAQDFYPIAKQCLKDRMLRETIDLVLRFAAKKAAGAGLAAIGSQLMGDTGGDLVQIGADIAGAATEKADTRNWQTLPATISYTRVPLHEGENKFVIRKQGPEGIDTDTLVIPFKRGLQIVNYYDVGRTQVIPNQTENTASAAQTKGAGGIPLIKKEILEKYDTWHDAGNGVSYKVNFRMNRILGQELYEKKITLKQTGTVTKTITYTVTETPFDNNYTEVKQADYKNATEDGKPSKEYFKITQQLKPDEEVSYLVHQTTPDFYVTIFKAE